LLFSSLGFWSLGVIELPAAESESDRFRREEDVDFALASNPSIVPDASFGQ
jgi:hypothetical protein